MHLKYAALLASAMLATAGIGSGAAWAIDNGTEVRVNPVAGGGGTLLYPGGQYARSVPQLLTPGETRQDLGPVHLHMPTHKPVRESAPRLAALAPSTSAPPAAPAVSAPAAPISADAVPAEPAPKAKKAAPSKPKEVAAATPKPAAPKAAPSLPGYNPGYGNFGAPQGAAGLSASLAAPAPSSTPSSTPSAAPAPTRVARATPPPASAAPAASGEPATPGLTKRSVILFAPQASDPAESALGAIKFLAGDLNAAMSSPGARIQIQAFGGAHGDKGSDARRLSLKRALAIRQVLIDDGVAAERIDVRAMGGADDTGPTDRVDVYIKA